MLSNTAQMTIFLSERQHCACNTVQLQQRSRLIQHLSKNDFHHFRVSQFSQVVQKHKLFDCLLSVTFLPKMSKSIHVCQSYRQREMTSHIYTIAIRSPFCRSRPSYCAQLSDENLSRYSNKIESVGLRKCPYKRCLTKKVMPE